LPPFFLTFSQHHEKKSASLQKFHTHLVGKIHLHQSTGVVLKGVRGNDRCLSRSSTGTGFCRLHQGHRRWLRESIRARMQKGHFIWIHYKWIYILCLGPRTRFVSQCKYLSLNVDSSFLMAKKEKCFLAALFLCCSFPDKAPQKQLRLICRPNWMVCHNFIRGKYPVSWFACILTLQVNSMINILKYNQQREHTAHQIACMHFMILGKKQYQEYFSQIHPTVNKLWNEYNVQTAVKQWGNFFRFFFFLQKVTASYFAVPMKLTPVQPLLHTNWHISFMHSQTCRHFVRCRELNCWAHGWACQSESKRIIPLCRYLNNGYKA